MTADQWGAAYGRIPKPIWALLVWHLAMANSEDDADGPTARVLEEIQALADSGLIPARTARRVAEALQEV